MSVPDFAHRLSSLRQQMKTEGYNGFLVPMADAFQSEYVPPAAQRIGFLSGFTGSAGFIAVLEDKAAFFTDSRYTLQASQQVSKDLFMLFDSMEQSPIAWLEEHAGQGSKIAYDPWLHSAENAERFKTNLAKKNIEAIASSHNLVDAIWVDRPPEPAEPVVPHDILYAGISSSDKRRSLAEQLKKKNLSAAIISDPTSVAWLLNVRGNDVANTPLPLSRALLHDDATVEWFLDPRKISETLQAHVGGEVKIISPQKFGEALASLSHRGKPVLLDADQAADWIAEHLKSSGVNTERGADLCELPRSLKNATEIDGMRAAHRRDGAALAKFFAWLEQNWSAGNISELGVERKLADFREMNNNYRGPSFDTIAGAGAHGAIVHYRATRLSDSLLKSGQLFLLDSGGQYLDGTTDVTRTTALGLITDEMRDRYTRVLKGHIALARIRFPEGTTGAELDVLARQYLWDVGLDYGHGTGHGVGCYLGVHEGPQGISRRNKTVLQPGMVVSNEPGFYKNGEYGIRIENLQTVVEIIGLAPAGKKMLGFETLTLAPIDRKAIDTSLLTAVEINWLNAYHARVLETIKPMVDASTILWLEAACRPLEQRP